MVQSAFPRHPIRQRTRSSKNPKGRVGPKQNLPMQLQNHTFIEIKSNQDHQVAEAPTSANQAVEDGGDAFLV
jgi:hypothetical protein